MSLRLLLLFVVLLVFSCKKGESTSYDTAVQTTDEFAEEKGRLELAPVGSGGKTGGGGDPSVTVSKKGVLGIISGDEPTTPSAVAAQSQKLIKTGRLSFQVKSFVKAKQEIRALIPQFSAYISSENENNYENNQQSVMEIRVPSDKFDALVDAVSKSANQFDEKVISVQDVGEEFADVTARMIAKKEVEIRYRAILTKANKISEILEIEQKIGEVRSEIESMQGRLNYLQSQVSYSTLTVTFYERHTAPVGQRENFFARIFSSFVNGWNGLLNFAIGLTAVWPFMIFVTIVFIVIRKGIRHRKPKKNV